MKQPVPKAEEPGSCEVKQVNEHLTFVLNSPTSPTDGDGFVKKLRSTQRKTRNSFQETDVPAEEDESMLGSSKLTNSRSKKARESQGKKSRSGARKELKHEVKEEILSANENSEIADDTRTNKTCEYIAVCDWGDLSRRPEVPYLQTDDIDSPNT